MKWMVRARSEISKSADRGAAKTDETQVSAVLAVAGSPVSGNEDVRNPGAAAPGTANTDETGLLSVLAVGHSQVSGERPAADPRRAERQRRAVELLRQHPGRRRAVVVDGDTRGDAVVVTVAVRDRDEEIAVGDLHIPRNKYDPFAILAALEASEQ